jgi:hypothetical protein
MVLALLLVVLFGGRLRRRLPGRVAGFVASWR